MILTTTPSVEGKQIKKYLGVVTGTDIYLVGGIFGGGLGNQENLFGAAYANACGKMEEKAKRKHANAIVGIQTQVLSPGNLNNIIVVVTGTAVYLENMPISDARESDTTMSDELPDL